MTAVNAEPPKDAMAVLAEAKARHAEARELFWSTKRALNAAVRAARPNPMGCRDAAALVLRDFPDGLNVKAILRAIYERRLWRSPSGLTPANTLAIEMNKEIRRKGAASRFARPRRGIYIANPPPPQTA